MSDLLNCAYLRTIFESVFPRDRRDDFHTAKGRNCTRMRRALSWLEAASKCRASTEERFMFMWISFNAIYGDEPLGVDESLSDDGENESKKMMAFLDKIKSHGQDSIQAVISGNKKDFAEILENRFMHSFFWKWVREQENNKEYEHRLMLYSDHWNTSDEGRRFQSKNRWLIKNTGSTQFLPQVFWRLYTLRNQLLHGGATYCSEFNRSSIQQGDKALSLLLPVILEIIFANIKNNPDTNEWGRIWYPPFMPNPE